MIDLNKRSLIKLTALTAVASARPMAVPSSMSPICVCRRWSP